MTIAFNTAHQHIQSAPFSSDPRRIYHVLNPHPALSPVPDSSDPETIVEQNDNEIVYQQLLVQGALAVLLPTEDLENTCLRTLVGDVITDLILGNGISQKACDGWFIWESITKLVETVKARLEPKATGEEIEMDTRSRLERYGLLSSKEAVQKGHSSSGNQLRISALFWRILQYGYLTFLVIRFVLIGLVRAFSLPPRSHSPSKSSPSSPIVKSAEAPATWTSTPLKRPVLTYRVFNLVSHFLDLSTRMPWLAGLLSLIQHYVICGPGRMGETDGVLDK